MKNGIINLNTNRAKSHGFTSDKFHGYLWKRDILIWISNITSIAPGKGNIRALFDNIEKAGYCLMVPTPSNRMKAICERRGMILMLLMPIETGGDCLEAMVNKKDYEAKLKK